MTLAALSEVDTPQNTVALGAFSDPAVPRRRPTFTSVALVDRAGQLADITHPEITLALWQRSTDPKIEYEVAGLTAGQLPSGRIALSTAETQGSCMARLQGLLQEHGVEPGGFGWWLADMAMLAEQFTELVNRTLGPHTITARVETLDDVACPKFHVDRTRLRLLCTYRGPGTEWLPDEEVDRAALEDRQPNAQIQRGAQPRALQPFWVGLFKGECFPGNAGRGQVHRSPAVPPGSMRVLFCLDA
ncbi:MAG: DUF1826 domain-containing protein [Lamprobacter sp.]|uniref:DUF1826 domain-containing protein n=1 Tax=Lamprobacter sp. TaxID=3100796 RepID=UPI002B26276E|nr:DUF1826 domain-containing protein [Lamprobacter sp.]MEA3641396.1 DUF1826 domain-containing protein [Lamprobacter sp.]